LSPNEHWVDNIDEALARKDELLAHLPFADVEIIITGPIGFQPLTFRPDSNINLPPLSSEVSVLWSKTR